MRLPSTAAGLAAIALAVAACHLSDSNRCDGTTVYDPDLGACVELDSDSEGPDGDAGADAGPSGLMEPCESQEDCAGFDASFCNLLMAPHVCLIPDCTTSPDDCPGGYFCCDFSPDIEETAGLPDSLCIPDDSLATVEAYCQNL